MIFLRWLVNISIFHPSVQKPGDASQTLVLINAFLWNDIHMHSNTRDYWWCIIINTYMHAFITPKMCQWIYVSNRLKWYLLLIISTMDFITSYYHPLDVDFDKIIIRNKGICPYNIHTIHIITAFNDLVFSIYTARAYSWCDNRMYCIYCIISLLGYLINTNYDSCIFSIHNIFE